MMSASENQSPVKVSIVLPTYNQRMFLAKAIESILNQTFANFELIVVNDGSTDDTANFLATVKHPKLRVISQANQGLPGALNTGFAAARGEYWTWTSSDNMVAPTWLEELVKALDNSPAEVGYAFSSYAVIDENGKLIYINRDLRFDIPSLLMHHTGNASFLYRAEFAKKVGPYDIKLSHAEDMDMWVRMASLTRAVFVETVLYFYRQHSSSMTSQSDRVREATKGVVTKFLAKSGGLFDVDKLFPSIALSADPEVERWKSRAWLATLGARAMYYCPVDACVDQLTRALNHKYESGLVGNIVHLLAKEDRWDVAAQMVAKFQQHDSSDALKQLANIVARKAKDELQNIPFMIVEEKYLAADCKSSLSQQELQRNLAATIVSAPMESKPTSFEKLITSLVNQIEDQKDHPEIWQNIASLESPDEKKMLNQLRECLTALTKVPQEPLALMLIQILEAVCLGHTGNIELGKSKLELLIMQNPTLQTASGALAHLNFVTFTNNSSVTTV